MLLSIFGPKSRASAHSESAEAFYIEASGINSSPPFQPPFLIGSSWATFVV